MSEYRMTLAEAMEQKRLAALAQAEAEHGNLWAGATMTTETEELRARVLKLELALTDLCMCLNMRWRNAPPDVVAEVEAKRKEKVSRIYSKLFEG